MIFDTDAPPSTVIDPCGACGDQYGCSKCDYCDLPRCQCDRECEQDRGENPEASIDPGYDDPPEF